MSWLVFKILLIAFLKIVGGLGLIAAAGPGALYVGWNYGLKHTIPAIRYLTWQRTLALSALIFSCAAISRSPGLILDLFGAVFL